MTVRKCSTCKHYEPAPIWRKGWCRNPLLYSPQQSHLVGEEELDCDRGMGNYWEALDAAAGTADARSLEPDVEELVDAPQPAARNTTTNHAQPIFMKASHPSNLPEGKGTGGGGTGGAGRPSGAGRSGSDGGGGDTGPFGGSSGGDTGRFGGSGSGGSGRGGGLSRFTRGGKSGGSGRGGGLGRFTGGGKSGGLGRFTGGGGGGGDDDDDGTYVPPPREPQRPAGTPERQFSYYAEQRYWTDYLRIAAPVLGVILILGLVWFWLGSLMGGGTPAPSPSPSASTAAAASASPGAQQSPLIIAEAASPSPASSPRVVATPGASQSPDASTFVFAKGDKAVVGNTDGDGANLRAKPDSSSDIVTVLNDGTKLDITGDSIQSGPTTWWPVTTPDGDQGYISEDLLKPSS